MSRSNRVDVAASAAAPPKLCNQRCQKDVETFQGWSKNVGRASEGGLDNVSKYADYIRERPALRDELIRLAENQSDGDFSRLLVASFQYLEPQEKIKLSRALMTSPAWDIRRKTTSLFTSQEVLATQDEAQIAALLSRETDRRVAVPILKGLGQSSVVREKPQIMGYINKSVSQALDPEIRGAALIAQTQLALGDATDMPAPVLESIQSLDPIYSSYGFQAADLVLAKLHTEDTDAQSPVFQETKRALERIRNSEIDLLPERVFVEAEDLYLRYFQ